MSEIPELSVQSILNATSSRPLFGKSINGSLVDQFNPRRARHHRQKATASHSRMPFPISIGIKAGNSETIDLSDPTQRQLLGEEQKAQAKEQIMAMQEQMKNLIASWN